MKKVIKASKYSDEAAKYEKWIGIYADIISNVVAARDNAEMAAALEDAGKMFSRIPNKPEAIKALVRQLSDVVSDYLLATNANASLPAVRDELISYLKQLGYPMIKVRTPGRGFDEAYVILPADECEHEDLKTVASAVSKEFGLRPDTGIIGGSWTSYGFKMNGVAFRIGFEQDLDYLDYDPSSKEYSLQLTF